MREKILFNEDWLFFEGDIPEEVPAYKGPVYMQSKTEHKIYGPASRFYNAAYDSYDTSGLICTQRWQKVTLPHDYVIFQTPKEENNNALGFFSYENAWYRKKFSLTQEDKNKRLILLFEGIATHAVVYLNGCVVGRNFCGYTSFTVDISDFVKFDEENVLAVYVNAKEIEGWWYAGGGIYRDVYLLKTDLVAIDLWGVYAMPKKCGGVWRSDVQTEVINDTYTDATVETVTIFYDHNQQKIAEGRTEKNIPPREKTTLCYDITIKDPVLWDLDHPYLYRVVTKLYKNGDLCDEYEIKTGFRTYEIDGQKGMFLNGKQVQIKGVCAHQDFGLTGKAVPNNIHRYKIELIKQMGANGYRTSHYPHCEAVMDALDELGFVVMDETRWFSSSDEAKQQLSMLVKRDRNRPSVCFWSVGNEEPYHITPEGTRICKNLVAFVKKLDDTRFVISAVSNNPDEATVYEDLDAIGVNYNLDLYDALHAKYPDKGIFASECCATGTTRGWYYADCPEKGFLSAYDKDTDSWFLGRENTGRFLCERSWVLGGYQWIAFEHRGEAVWPRVCSQAGAIDLFLQKKDAFYQNQSHWLETPMIHLLPHWNFVGREGEIISVWAYTNCEETELVLNGKSLGRIKIEKCGHGEWQVPYEKGVLEVFGYCGGKQVCADKRVTSGRAAKLVLRADNLVTQANGRDIAVITCFLEDENGVPVPEGTVPVSFFTNGLGRVVGTGGSVADHNPVQCTTRAMHAGKAVAAVQVGKTAGVLKVYAASDLFDTAMTEIPLAP